VGLADLSAQDVHAPERRSGVHDGVHDDMCVMVLRVAHAPRVAAAAQLSIPIWAVVTKTATTGIR
jgi:hypothetical protein